jgi:polyisoprenoid-binding protein YceI
MATATAQAVRTFGIDKNHSEAVFQVRHLVTKVRGRFTDFDGTITMDEESPERSSVEVVIQAASIDTAQPDRDAHLRSADFFDVEKFPTITFRSTGVKKLGTDRYEIAGDLAIHGVTKPVVLATTFLGQAKDPWGNERVGFEAETSLNRKDYGLTWNAALETGGFLVGDEIKIALSVQGIAK